VQPCSVNDSSNDYVAMVTIVNGAATRSQTFGGVTSTAAQKTISTLMIVQPVEAPPHSASTPYELAMQKITPADAAALKY